MPNNLNTIVYVHDHNEKPVNGKYFVVNAIVSCSLEHFSKNDVVKISGKFVIKKNEDDEQVIKVVLSDLVILPISPSDLPPNQMIVTLNATAMDPPNITELLHTIKINSSEYIESMISMDFTMYHLNTDQHLQKTTSMIKRESILFATGNLEIQDICLMIRITYVNFVEAKSPSSVLSSPKAGWEWASQKNAKKSSSLSSLGAVIESIENSNNKKSSSKRKSAKQNPTFKIKIPKLAEIAVNTTKEVEQDHSDLAAGADDEPNIVE
ncbi:3211_t:CDS:2 [Entrophospora sp. SA101]|nr:3206_t:CDS:2 [Entrophospora sp. SA101]CAJ0643362.1 3211_t:CDS:2 [Entrophospora sp. SA101]